MLCLERKGRRLIHKQLGMENMIYFQKYLFAPPQLSLWFLDPVVVGENSNNNNLL